MDKLSRAVALATTAHRGQLDKQGKPYVEHLVRVMNSVEGESAQVVAIFHDILEDTPTTLRQLYALGCLPAEVTAIQALSRMDHETYHYYIRRVSKNPLAVKVKIADLKDNLSRIDGISEDDQKRLRPRYEKALAFLETL